MTQPGTRNKPTDTLTYLLSRLSCVHAAGDSKWMAQCPAHDDGTPSLSIADAGDHILIHCHAGCETRDICAALGLRLRDLFFTDRTGQLSDTEIAARVSEQRVKRETEKAALQEIAARNAKVHWRASHPAHEKHKYLVRKQISPLNARQRKFNLLVPIVYRGALVNVQYISTSGNKNFMKNGRVRGCYSPIGRMEEGKPLYLCEGWATGATIYEMFNCPVACAMNSGNLYAAGQELKILFPNVELIIAGDDDRLDEKNPGRTAATQAADLLGCAVIFPEWKKNDPKSLTDFNDWAQRRRSECRT